MLKKLKQFKLPEVEEQVLKFWKENQIFEKSLDLRKDGEKYRFFEGPPTANGRPGIHHMLGRAFKDIIPRYKTMQGYFVRRKAGWDTHGLPVEIEVEKALGLKNKQEIEKFGIAEFNEKAKDSVWKYQDEWEKLTDRIGFWLDLNDPYITYKPEYVETLWWVLKNISDRGYLNQSFKIVPYCPRCQTPLSSHEMGQPGVYKKVKDPSVFVKFKIKNKKSKENEYLLVWTTTPWTLPSNVAIAVNPTLTYTKYKIGGEYVWSYNPPPVDDNSDLEVVEKMSGKKLIGLKYEPIFDVEGPWQENKKFYQVYGADFVSTEDGTGLVHIAPAFGEDDLNVIKKEVKDLVGKIPITIDGKGLVQKGLPGGGKFAKTADKFIIEDLEKRNILLKSELYEHDYPFCWRCGTPILYFAQFSWFIEMSRLQKELIKNNEKINWIPKHVKEGRFGTWINEIKDWAISRNRYWGTPLPIWRCDDCENVEVIGSLDDLDKHRYYKNNFYILRHGEADHILTNEIASGPEKGKSRTSKLTNKGVKQIEEAAEKFVKKLNLSSQGKQKLDLIISSPYYRTKQTARIVSKATGAKVITDKRLEELNTGVYNWRTIDDYHKFFNNQIERFTKAPNGGENLTDAKKRMFNALLDINKQYENKNILIVSHGDPLWLLQGAVNGLSNEEILESDYIRVDGDVQDLNLHNRPYNLNGEVDLHRPYVDEIYLRCDKCNKKMTRIKEVADVWFDSGSMPFAQDHFPFTCDKVKKTNLEVKDLQKCIDYPADYISEGMDQTRGWFYTLLAVATALGLDEPPYKNIITFGLVLDKDGQKMSKSKGNVVSPWDMIEKYGADMVRWYFYTVNSPGEPKKFDEVDLGKMFRKFIMIIYNSYVFLETYGKETMRLTEEDFEDMHLLDRWIITRLNKTIADITKGLDKYDIGWSGKKIEEFVDDLSRWYIRRSRPRLQKPTDNKDFENASSTLYYCLLELSKLIAPFTPFFADALYQSLDEQLGRDKKISVHLENWPKVNKKMMNDSLLERMEEVRRISSLVLALRAEKGIKVRQPLATLEIKSKKLDVRDKEFIEILKDEVNVKDIKWNYDQEEEIVLDIEITPELKEEGILRDLVRMVQGLRQDANYIPKDVIGLMIEAGELNIILEKYVELIKKEVGAKSVSFKKDNNFDKEKESKLDGKEVWLAVKKI